jgi:hypothetical protein
MVIWSWWSDHGDLMIVMVVTSWWWSDDCDDGDLMMVMMVIWWWWSDDLMLVIWWWWSDDGDGGSHHDDGGIGTGHAEINFFRLQLLVFLPSSEHCMNLTRSLSCDMYSETRLLQRSDFSAHTSRKTTRYEHKDSALSESCPSILVVTWCLTVSTQGVIFF